MQPTILTRSLLAPLAALIPAQPAPVAAQAVGGVEGVRVPHP